MLQLFLNKSLVVKSPVFFNFIQRSFGCNNKNGCSVACSFYHDTEQNVDFEAVWNGFVTDSAPRFVFRRPNDFAFCIVRGNRCAEMVELVINQVGLRFRLLLVFGLNFQQRIGFGGVAVRFGGFVFPFYAYWWGRLKLCQRFECTGFEQVMGVLSVCAFNGKDVFLPVVNGGFPVAILAVRLPKGS